MSAVKNVSDAEHAYDAGPDTEDGRSTPENAGSSLSTDFTPTKCGTGSGSLSCQRPRQNDPKTRGTLVHRMATDRIQKLQELETELGLPPQRWQDLLDAVTAAWTAGISDIVRHTIYVNVFHLLRVAHMLLVKTKVPEWREPRPWRPDAAHLAESFRRSPAEFVELRLSTLLGYLRSVVHCAARVDMDNGDPCYMVTNFDREWRPAVVAACDNPGILAALYDICRLSGAELTDAELVERWRTCVNETAIHVVDRRLMSCPLMSSPFGDEIFVNSRSQQRVTAQHLIHECAHNFSRVIRRGPIGFATAESTPLPDGSVAPSLVIRLKAVFDRLPRGDELRTGLEAGGWTDEHFVQVEAGHYVDFASGDADALDMLGTQLWFEANGPAVLCPFSGWPRPVGRVQFRRRK